MTGSDDNILEDIRVSRRLKVEVNAYWEARDCEC
jgi:hypothetical protein